MFFNVYSYFLRSWKLFHNPFVFVSKVLCIAVKRVYLLIYCVKTQVVTIYCVVTLSHVMSSVSNFWPEAFAMEFVHFYASFELNC